MNNIDALRDLPDEALVKLSIEGSTECFACLIERYKNLVCSITYCVAGGVQASEDLAQEVFVVAWKTLANLRDHTRFKSWLCAIARNLTRNFQRREQVSTYSFLQPALEESVEPGTDHGPAEVLITKEEEQLLWDAIREMPMEYREPLVLFYREDNSVRKVAESLDLSEDAVKQRLSRARAMLRMQLADSIEGSLRKTRPGKAFTIGAIALLSMSGVQAGAATLTAASTGASSPLKTAAAIGASGAVLGTVAGLLGGFIGARASYKAAQSDAERKFVLRFVLWICGGVAMFSLALLGILFFGKSLVREHPLVLASLISVAVVSYMLGLVIVIFRANERQRQIQMEQGTYNPAQDLPLGNQNPKAILFSLLIGVVGSLSWVFFTTLQRAHWTYFFLTAGIGFIAVIVFYQLSLANRQRAMGCQITACALMGIWTLFILNYRPGVLLVNIEKTGEWKGAIILAVNLFIILLHGGILGSIWLRDRRAVFFHQRHLQGKVYK